MDDDDEIDLYEDLPTFDLNKECEKLQANINKLQAENAKFIETIDGLLKEKEKLVQENLIMQKNISVLLKTAKQEIQRKDAKILELRTELGKIEAKKFVRENPVVDEKLANLVKKSSQKVDESEGKVKSSAAKEIKRDIKSRLGDKVSERFDGRSTRGRFSEDRYRRYPRKSRSKSPSNRPRNKSPFDRKRRRSRSPVVSKKRRYSRSRSPRKISKSPVRTAKVSPPPEKPPEPLKPPEIVKNPEKPVEVVEKPEIDREDGEIVSDQCETVDNSRPKTLYSARMEQRLRKEQEEVKEAAQVSPTADNAQITEEEPKQSTVESFSPFKDNYKLIPFSPDVKKKPPEEKIAFNVEKPQKPLQLADLATKTDPKPAFDVKTYRIPKKKPAETKKPVKRPQRTRNPPDSDIANFEIFKNVNGKNTSSSSLDQSSETRRLRSDLHLTDSDAHHDENEVSTEDSSGSDASDFAEDF